MVLENGTLEWGYQSSKSYYSSEVVFPFCCTSQFLSYPASEVGELRDTRQSQEAYPEIRFNLTLF